METGRGKFCSKKCLWLWRSENEGRENNPNWKGGISKEPYPFEFDNDLKEYIRARDNYKCQVCGCPELENRRKLNIHHIDYDKENLDPDNLISLCDNCHSISNGNRKKWTEYFRNKIMMKKDFENSKVLST